MDAGRLRHRVTVTKAVEVGDGHHGFDESSLIVAIRIPAEVLPLSGAALLRAQQIDARATHMVRVRFRTGLETGQTVTYHTAQGDRPFEIVAPPRDLAERHDELQLLCKEQAATT